MEAHIVGEATMLVATGSECDLIVADGFHEG